MPDAATLSAHVSKSASQAPMDGANHDLRTAGEG